MSKDLFTKVASEQMTDPNFSPKGEPQSLADPSGAPSVDFTKATNDISKPAKLTLGAYLSVQSAKNAYPVQFSSSDSQPLEVKSRGENASLMQAGKNGQKIFADSSFKNQGLQSVGLGVKNAQQKSGENRLVSFFDSGQIDEVLSKDASDASLLGHTLLSDVPASTTNPIGKSQPSSPMPAGEARGIKLLRAVHQQLSDGNMYSPEPGYPFIKNPGGTNEEDVTHGLFTIQRDLGSFDEKGQRVQVSDMSAIAMSLLLRSVGNMKGSEILLQNKSLGKASFTALLPFLRPEQQGLTGNGIDVYRLKYIKSELTNATGKTAKIATSASGQDDFFVSSISNGNNLTSGAPPNNGPQLPNLQSWPRNKGSYAQLNSFLEPFSVGTRFSSTGMMLLGTSALLIAIGIGLALQKTVGIAEKIKTLQTRKGRVLGKHKADLNDSAAFSNTLSKLLEITDTDFPFGQCLSAGIPLMFGVPENTSITLDSLNNTTVLFQVAQNLALSGGYYANFMRRILAEGTSVVGSFTKIGSNVTQSAENVLRGIETLLNSATYKFIMIAAGVGDAALKSKLGMVDLAEDQLLLPRNNLVPSIMQQGAPVTKYAKIAQQRMQTNRWEEDNKNSQSLHTFLATQKELALGISPSNPGNRFMSPSRDNVESVENSLEAEYMPFYIHDLRTHEAMSFPAFITEFSEAFNANYNAVKGIGRQDPVRLYAETERTANFGFMLVAFNENDHDHLWMAVNKLVAMCYPQYSSGRVRKTEDGKNFVQPFSQVQAASPMVRLRLADVFKSNYSKFGLARLFGANSSSFVDESSKYKNALANLRDAESLARDNVELEFLNVKSGSTTFPIGASVKLKATGMAKGISGELISYNGKVLRFVEGDEATVVTVLGINGTYSMLHERSKTIVTVNVEDVLSYTDAYIKNRIDADGDVQNRQRELETYKTSFFNQSDNAIVRSFETTKGRGVAGFITTLSLDYGMGSYPWSDKMGSKAPMVVKISMGFAPITDLPLGLDYDGHIRNPSHPVGNLAGGYGDPYAEIQQSGNENEFLRPKSRSEINNLIKKSWNEYEMLK